MGKYKDKNGHSRLRALVEKAKKAGSKIPKEVLDLAASEIPGFNLVRAALAIVRKDNEVEEPMLREELEIVLLDMYAEMEFSSRRHETDTWSDSWLSKNVRPLTFLIVLAVYIWMTFANSFFYKVDYEAVQAGRAFFFNFSQATIDKWGQIVEWYTLFYVGSRGLEKITSMIAPAMAKQERS